MLSGTIAEMSRGLGIRVSEKVLVTPVMADLSYSGQYPEFRLFFMIALLGDSVES